MAKHFLSLSKESMNGTFTGMSAHTVIQLLQGHFRGTFPWISKWAKRPSSSSSSCFLCFWGFEEAKEYSSYLLTHLANGRKTRFSPQHGIPQNSAYSKNHSLMRVVMAMLKWKKCLNTHQIGNIMEYYDAITSQIPTSEQSFCFPQMRKVRKWMDLANTRKCMGVNDLMECYAPFRLVKIGTNKAIYLYFSQKDATKRWII